MTGRTIGLVAQHVKAEGLNLLRLPAYWIPTLLFPVMLYGFFGLPFSDDERMARILMASWCVYAVLGVCFYQFGVGVAEDRKSPWDVYLRSLPAGPGPRFAALLLVAVLFAAAGVALVWIVASLITGLSLGAALWLRLALALVAGAVPFVLFGIALGYLVPARVAVPIANLILLPLSFAGGLWLPPERLQEIAVRASEVLPTRHFAELAWAAVLALPWPLASLAWLAAYGLAFAALALWAYRRDEGRRYR